jgi:hypothetical protein
MVEFFGTDESTGLPLVEQISTNMVPGCPFCGEPLDVEWLLGHYRFTSPTQKLGPCTEHPINPAILIMKFTIPGDTYHTLIYKNDDNFWMLSAWENYDIPKVQLTLVTPEVVSGLVSSATEGAVELNACLKSLHVLKTLVDPAIYIPVQIKLDEAWDEK